MPTKLRATGWPFRHVIGGPEVLAGLMRTNPRRFVKVLRSVSLSETI